MPIDVLQTKADNRNARRELRRRRLDFTSSFLIQKLRKKIFHSIAIGDRCKNWDVLKTLDMIDKNVPRSGPVLDIGAYASEVLCALQRMGYSDLTGIDLNPDILNMPYTDKIHYHIGNFMKTPFLDASFSAVTAISVIEHGFSSGPLFAELSRIIKPGGYFLASVDYWPDKIDTTGIKAFGLDWKIFSRDELLALVKEAGRYGFSSFGDVRPEAYERTVSWQGKKYTFAWFALKKDESPR